jgi:hypothetical protein
MKASNWSGYFSPWFLADAVKWRLRHGADIQKAFKELAALGVAALSLLVFREAHANATFLITAFS